MTQYRKKPIVIEAFRVLSPFYKSFCPNWFNQARSLKWPTTGAARVSVSANYVQIMTLEGIMTANAGDWIIKGVKGEIYPCKNDIFELTYEEAT